MISNNLAFSLGEKLLQLIKSTLATYDSATVQESTLYDKQISFIAKSCISAFIVGSMFAALEDSPFSLSIDGGSDKFGEPYSLSLKKCQKI